MIIDMTQSKIEFKMMIADVQQQLAQVCNDPNLTIVCGYPLSYRDLTDEDKKCLAAWKSERFEYRYASVHDGRWDIATERREAFLAAGEEDDRVHFHS